MTYCTLLAFLQLTLMFLWGAAVFHLDLFTHLPGFLAMTAATSFAVASFGICWPPFRAPADSRPPSPRC